MGPEQTHTQGARGAPLWTHRLALGQLDCVTLLEGGSGPFLIRTVPHSLRLRSRPQGGAGRSGGRGVHGAWARMAFLETGEPRCLPAGRLRMPLKGVDPVPNARRVRAQMLALLLVSSS